MNSAQRSPEQTALVASYYNEISQHNLSNIISLMTITKQSTDEVVKTLLAVHGNQDIYKKMVKNEARENIIKNHPKPVITRSAEFITINGQWKKSQTSDELTGEAYNDWLDEETEELLGNDEGFARSFLQLETGTHALIASNIFQAATNDLSLHELVKNNNEWRTALIKGAFEQDKISISLEALHDVWMDATPTNMEQIKQFIVNCYAIRMATPKEIETENLAA